MIKDAIIYGKKTVLMPFKLELDLENFVELHRNDKRDYMMNLCFKEFSQEDAKKYATAMVMTERIKVWTVLTKEGRHSKTAGFIYLSEISDVSASISGIMTGHFLKQLAKSLKKNVLSCAEDATLALIDTCLNKFDFQRIEANVLKDNRLFLSLHKRLGLKEEGTLRSAININGELKDVVILSILKREWSSVQQTPESRDTKIQRAG